jgi:hypothetical protein
MKKGKLFILIVILAIVSLFGTAAICNQCSVIAPESTEEITEETISEESESVEATTEKDNKEEASATEEETTETEEVTEETVAEATEAEVTETEEAIGEGSGEATVFTPDVNKNLSGYIVSDGTVLTRTVMIGDSVSNKDIKGYISFDISELLNSPIVSAELKISNIAAAVDPTFAEQLNIKVYDYGDSLDAGDFAVGGDLLTSIPTTGLTSINISGDNLKNLIKKSIEAGKNYFQLKMGLSTATDNDNTADLFAINLDSAKLTVTQ